MIIFLICLLAYIPIGVVVARVALPSIIQRNTYQKGDRIRSLTPEYLAESGYHHSKNGIYRTCVTRDFWFMIFSGRFCFGLTQSTPASASKWTRWIQPSMPGRQRASRSLNGS